MILEFSTYNVNINLFAVATLAAEWIPGGGIRTFTRIDPIRLITVPYYTVYCILVILLYN